MDKLFHATFHSYLPSIIRHGLGARQCKNWSNSERNVVYLTDDQEVACSFCEAAEETTDEVYNSGIIILEIDAHGLELEVDSNIIVDTDDESPLFMLYRGIIPAGRIRNISILED